MEDWWRKIMCLGPLKTSGLIQRSWFPPIPTSSSAITAVFLTTAAISGPWTPATFTARRCSDIGRWRRWGGCGSTLDRDFLVSRGVNVGDIQQDGQGTHFFEMRDLEGNVIEISEEP